jgi:hypothetical protein
MPNGEAGQSPYRLQDRPDQPARRATRSSSPEYTSGAPESPSATRPGAHNIRKADSMSIVITEASGQLGRLTAELVLDRVPASEVILTTRWSEALSDLAELRGLRQAGGLRPARDARRVVRGRREAVADQHRRPWPSHGPAPRRHRSGQGGRRASHSVHVLPQPRGGEHGRHHPSHQATEKALRESGLAWTMLRNSFYADLRILVSGSCKMARARREPVPKAGP